VIDETLKRAGVTLQDLDAVAVANEPGLAGSLLVGVVAAKTLALTLNIPLVAINHLQGHIYACRMSAGHNVFPCVGLVVSGGHTSLYECRSALDFKLLGGTIDDAAGEAFDKVAKMLGLGYPGGPAISKCAKDGDPTAFQLPRSFIKEQDRLQFSFSGLKTAVRYKIAGPGKPIPTEIGMSDSEIADLCASFEQAVVDCLVAKSLRACEITGLPRLCVGGGVAANGRFREQLTEGCAARSIELTIAPIHLCTDNAVMGAIAIERLKAGMVESLEMDALPGLVRK
jgi:N6-L-threonylcarbamoyladenine synthase